MRLAFRGLALGQNLWPGSFYLAWAASEVKGNLAEVRKRKQNIVERFRQDAERSLENTENLDLIRGEASFFDARTVRVKRAGGEDLHLRSEKIFINTDAKPVIPPIDGLGQVAFLDSTSVMELNELPEH